MIHKSVASAMRGLTEILSLQTLRAPDGAIADADRLECMLFSGFEPYFEGDEPPGLWLREASDLTKKEGQ